MEPVYVDSNVFFCAKIADPRYGEACARIIEDIAGGRLRAVASTLVVLEVASALRKYGLKRAVVDEINAICSLGITLDPLDESVVGRAGEIHHETQMHPYDCAHVATMRKLGVTEILSADKDFDKVSGILRIDPKSYAARK
jgi:hypothetical protein